MTTKSGWSGSQGSRALCPNDRLAAERTMARGAFDYLLAIEQQEEDRRLSAAGAFLMFLFGCGCGGTWTLVLTWLL